MGGLSARAETAQTNSEKVVLTLSHSTFNATGPEVGLGAGISFEIEDAGGVEEQGRVSIVMETVTNDGEDAKMVFCVQDTGTLSVKAEV